MSWSEDYEIRSLAPDVPSERAPVVELLERHGLEYDADIEYTIGLFQDDTLIATGSLAGRVIKGVVIDPAARGENLTATVLSYLKLTAFHRGVDSLFLYTTPENRDVFAAVGFTPIVATDSTLLLEDNKNDFPFYLHDLERLRRPGVQTAAVVMNCNPFTYGHRYLAERAAAENEFVVLFVVEEDLSVFPFSVRRRLVEDGVADLANVVVVPGGKYIISNATFPSYFLKDSELVNRAHAELDVTLFGRSIAPAAGITRRFVGHEPYCPVTAMYNETMKRILPEHGVDVVEVERTAHNDRAISASEVRRRIAAGDVDSTVELVPESTYRYLVSDEAAPIRAQLQGDGR